MNKLLKSTLALLLVAGMTVGCENFLEPSVDQAIPTETAIPDAAALSAVVLGAHDYMNNTGLMGRDFPVSMEVMSDNAWSNGNSGRFIAQSQINHTVNSGYAIGQWDGWYQVLSNLNLAINADLPSSPAADHAKGQAHALRALVHMNLLMQFGQQNVSGGDASLGIPYVTTYSEGNLYPARDPIADVWSKINDDFATGISLMDPSQSDITVINYWAAKALQTRAFLYQENYAQVISIAEDVINNSGYSLTSADDYVAIWNGDSSPGSMFEMAYSESDRTGNNSIARIYQNTNYGDVEVTDELYNMHDDNDVRKALYSAEDEDPSDARPLNYRMVGKFVVELGNDNVPVVRFAEVVLNYAEALAATGNNAQALVQINSIAANRNAPLHTSGSIENVWMERRLELAMEGHRFLDLVRTGRDIESVDPSQTIVGGTVPAGSYLFALPIPQAEMDANSSMVQNSGYN